MRTPVISFLLSALLAGIAAIGASAEVIHLKNGRTIWADHVRENGSHIQYDVGDDTYAIPKSTVDRIESGGLPPEYSASGTAKDSHDLPAFVPSDNLKNDPALIGKIIQNGQVDSDALSALEQAGNATATAAGYFIAGKHEFEHGNFAKARTYLEAALRFDSENPTFLNYYAALLVKTGNAPEALPYAERAVRAAPDSPDALTVLGYVQYAADRDRKQSEPGNTRLNSARMRPFRVTCKKPSAMPTPRPITPSTKAATSPCATKASRLRIRSAAS